MPRARLRRDSSIPLYTQLQADLIARIERGDFDDGPLPTEKEIGDRYGVSRATVRLAMDALVQEGYITRQRGRGSFVISLKKRLMGGAVRTLDDLASKHEVRTEVNRFEIQLVMPSIAQLFELPTTQEFTIGELIRIVDDEPLAIISVYIPYHPDLRIIERDFQEYVSVIDLFEERFGYRIIGGSRSLEAVQCRPDEAKLLEIEVGTPLLMTRTMVYEERGQPVYYAKSRYRSDHYRYYIPFLPRGPLASAVVERIAVGRED